MISNIVQWATNSLPIRSLLQHSSLGQVGIAATVACVAIPVLCKLANSLCARGDEKFVTWVVDGTEIAFFIKNDSNQVYLKVTRGSETLFTSGYMDLDPFYQTMDPVSKKAILRDRWEFARWAPNNIPLLRTSQANVVHKWVYEDQTICLVENGDKLLWKCTCGDKIYWVKDQAAENLTKEERIREIFEKNKPIKWDFNSNSPVLQDYQANRKCHFDNRTLCLVLREQEEQPLWELVNHKLKTTSWSPLDPNILKNYSKQDRIARIQVQQISGNSVIFPREVGAISLVQKNSMLSRFSGERIDSSNWAVTLIDVGSCGWQMSSWGGHAVIVVEGIEEQLPFTEYIDLRPKGKGKAQVTIEELGLQDQAHYRGILMNTIVKSKHIVHGMLENIRKERNESIPFDMFGKHTLCSSKDAHNCISWARDKLSLCDINFRFGPLTPVVDAPNQYYFF